MFISIIHCFFSFFVFVFLNDINIYSIFRMNAKISTRNSSCENWLCLMVLFARRVLPCLAQFPRSTTVLVQREPRPGVNGSTILDDGSQPCVLISVSKQRVPCHGCCVSDNASDCHRGTGTYIMCQF